MNRRPLIAVLVTATAAAVLLPVGTTPATAADPTVRTARVQATFSCQLAAKGYENQPSTEPVVISYQLEVPTSVVPGQAVSLRGVLSAQFTDELRELTEYFAFESLEGVSSDLGVSLTMAGRRTQHTADRWQTGRTAIGDPMVVRAPVTFPAFVVPVGATGSVEIAMPANDAVGNPYRFAPKRAAFTAAATVTGPTLTYTYLMACVLPKAKPSVLARIPVRAAATTGSPRSGSTAPTTGVAAAPGTGAPTAAPTALGPAPAAAPGAAVPTAAGPGSPAPVGAAPVAAAATSGPADRDGVRVQEWVLWLLLGLGLLGAIGYGVPAWIKIRRLEDELGL